MTTNTEKIFSFIDTYAESTEVLYLEAIIEVCQKWLSGESQAHGIRNSNKRRYS